MLEQNRYSPPEAVESTVQPSEQEKPLPQPLEELTKLQVATTRLTAGLEAEVRQNGIRPLEINFTNPRVQFRISPEAGARLKEALPQLFNPAKREVAGLFTLSKPVHKDGVDYHLIQDMSLLQTGKNGIVYAENGQLKPGEVEWHCHTLNDYLDTISNGDVLTALEGYSYVGFDGENEDFGEKVFAVISIREAKGVLKRIPASVSIQFYKCLVFDSEVLYRFKRLGNDHGVTRLGEPINLTV
ncbi:MAG: hypothetical protein M3Q81_03875 [bacterium]|nr:hypothetical protein [bacterium]